MQTLCINVREHKRTFNHLVGVTVLDQASDPVDATIKVKDNLLATFVSPVLKYVQNQNTDHAFLTCSTVECSVKDRCDGDELL